MNVLKLFLIISMFFNVYASVEFTTLEKQWIQNNPVIKVGVDENWPPFDYVDNYGNHNGVSSDYLSIISAKTGLNFEIYSDQWSKVFEKAKNNELQILACASKNKERREFFKFTDSYINVDIAVAVRKDFELNEFNDIANHRIALPKDNFIHEALKKSFPNAEFIFTKSNEEALEYISYGKADIYVGNLPVISYFTEKNLLTNITISFKAPFDKAELSIAVNKENEILYSILNKTLKSIPQSKRKEIQKLWVNDNMLSLKKSMKNILNNKEKKWLENNKTLKIAGDSHWPPYSFIDDKGEYIGIVPDLVNEIFKNTNINIQYVKTKTWSETLDLMEEKKIDLIDAISYSVSRTKFMNFTSKYLGAEIVIISNKTNDTYVNNLNNIINMNIATVKGYSIIEKIKHDYPKLKKIKLFDTPLDGLKSLSNSQIDYFILDIPSFEFYIKKYGLSNLKIVGPTGYNYEYGFGTKKGNPELVSIINKLLANLPDSSKDEIYRKWIKIDYDREIDYELVWKVIAFALFILAGTVYWNRKLKAEIIEKEKVEKKLEQSRDFAFAIMNSQVDIVITTTGEELKQANKAFLDFFEYSSLESFKEEYRCICDLFDTTDPNTYIQAEVGDKTWVEEVLSNPNNIYKALIYKDGKAHIFKISASYISKESDLKTAVFTDITKLENLNDILLKAKNEAENVAKQKSEFLANMSHEIRTPMNSVIGFTELLDKEISNPIQKDYLNSIKKGGNALLRIINDILDLSKIEAGKLDIKNEALNPSKLFLEIESIFHSKIISKNINFTIDIDKDIPENIIIDGVRIRQILFNLIGNAIKFTEKGHIKIKVDNIYKDNIKSKIDLIFSVEDTGIGIEKNDLKNIFYAFEQQKDQSSSKYGGTGLGLAICTKLVHMMNGEISVESTKGKGSIFTVLLHDISVSSVSESFECKKLNISNIMFDKATILVVDDISENRKLVEATLKDYGFNIIMAQNGQEAIDLLEKVNIDLILMDLRMPVMNGYDAAIHIKNKEKYKNIPLVALTASVMGKDLEKVAQYGFDGYLRKPVILDDLIEELGKFLPYSFVNEDNSKEILVNETVNIEKLDEVIHILHSQVKQECDEVKNKGDFSLIEDFALKIQELGVENNISILENYSSEIITHIESFDIEKVDYLLGSFSSIIEKLEVLKEKIEK